MTDEERCEVAENLRNMCICGCRYKEEFYDLLVETVMRAWDFHEFSDVADRLADLIEPEERRCRAGVFPDGAGAYVICCTECGYAIGGTWSDLGTARRMARAQHKFTNFCPNCGAKVVRGNGPTP